MLTSSQTSQGRDAGVLLDELAPRLDLVAHQHREEAVGGRRVVHRDLRQRAGRGVHRRLAQLLGVHLAQALEALELDALAGDRQHLAAQVLERQRLVALVAEPHVNGGVPASLTSSPCTRASWRYSLASNIERRSGACGRGSSCARPP